MKQLYINLYSNQIIFKVSDDATYNMVLNLFSNIIVKPNASIGFSNTIEITISKHTETCYTITYLDYIYSVNKYVLIEKLIDFISEPFDFFRNEQFCYFHASVVAKDNECVLIIAPTHNGKTTLCTRLTLIGYEYISDDLALIDEFGNLLAYPTPIKLRKNLSINVTDFEKTFSIINIPNYWILTPKKSIDLSKKYVPNKIVFLKRDPQNDEFYNFKLTRLETIKKLMKNASHIENLLLHSRISTLLSDSCSSYEIFYKDYWQIINDKNLEL